MADFGSFIGGAAGGAVVGITIKAYDQYSSALKKGEVSLKSFASVAGTTAKLVGASFVAIATLSLKSFAESEKVAFRVEKSFGKLSKAVLDFSSLMQSQSVETDETVAQAFVDLQTRTQELGLSFQTQSQIIQGSLDLSAASGIEFGTVLEAVSMGVMGQGRGLKQLGIYLDEDATKTEIYNAIMEKFAGVNGAAQQNTETLAGSMETLKNNLDDVVEAIGQELAPQIKEMSESIKGNKEEMVDFGSEVGKAFGKIISGLSAAFGWLWEQMNVAAVKLGAFIEKIKITKEVLTGKLGFEEGLAALKNVDAESEKAMNIGASKYLRQSKDYQEDRQMNPGSTESFDEYRYRKQIESEKEMYGDTDNSQPLSQKQINSLADNRAELERIATEENTEATEEETKVKKNWINQANVEQAIKDGLISGTTIQTETIGKSKTQIDSMTGSVKQAGDALNNLAMGAGGKGGGGRGIPDSLGLGRPTTRAEGLARYNEYQGAGLINSYGTGFNNGGYATYSDGSTGKTKWKDFMQRPGQPVTTFSPDDTIIGVKDSNKLGGKGLIINIGTLQGLSAEEISKALSKELRQYIAY